MSTPTINTPAYGPSDLALSAYCLCCGDRMVHDPTLGYSAIPGLMCDSCERQACDVEEVGETVCRCCEGHLTRPGYCRACAPGLPADGFDWEGE